MRPPDSKLWGRPINCRNFWQKTTILLSAFEGLFEFYLIPARGPVGEGPIWIRIFRLLTQTIGAAQRLNHGAADNAINWAVGIRILLYKWYSPYNTGVTPNIFPGTLYWHWLSSRRWSRESLYTTDRVLTWSFHKFGDYFPRTGHINDKRKDKE